MRRAADQPAVFEELGVRTVCPLLYDINYHSEQLYAPLLSNEVGQHVIQPPLHTSRPSDKLTQTSPLNAQRWN